MISKAKLSGTPRDTVYPWGKGVCEHKTTDCRLRQSVGQKRSYRGPRGILCTRGEKKHASKRVSIIACDNVISKAKCATCGRGCSALFVLFIFFITLQSFLLNKHAAQRHVTNCFFDQTIAVNVICLSFACLFLFPTSTIVSCGGPYANSRRTPIILSIKCRWPELCTSVQKFPAVTERQNFVLGSVRLIGGIKKDNQCGCLFLWCRWPDSNRHGIATGGF